MRMTTIKIESGLRDRINVAARDRGVTAGSFVEELFERWLREQHFVAMREAMACSTPEQVASWEQDQADWDALTTAGWPTDEPGDEPGPGGAPGPGARR